MSLVDWMFKRTEPDTEADDSLFRPPPATPAMLLWDLRWHRVLYAMDRLGPLHTIEFLALRVVQRLAYNIGWWMGGRS